MMGQFLWLCKGILVHLKLLLLFFYVGRRKNVAMFKILLNLSFYAQVGFLANSATIHQTAAVHSQVYLQRCISSFRHFLEHLILDNSSIVPSLCIGRTPFSQGACEKSCTLTIYSQFPIFTSTINLTGIN